ncbi:aspartyl-phosphate phosphatase Spo0E family protein [Paenibacillus rigui]|uniref:Sporulation protein Spo0E n=1 Tax=Paenibacillus rigui TaxID=554312 RepID=A0A229UGE1_9BACL|nr:aspartyl-phosphate phosphatase Spo0E family protein [Paenibacillus rigui]OXM82415.1 sporulation protein Spo0E [Paenibacillus rigui]
MVYLEEKIEQLRSELICLVEHTGTFIDSRVISLSQELDEILVEFEKQHTPLYL